jgi:hypothetical protein
MLVAGLSIADSGINKSCQRNCHSSYFGLTLRDYVYRPLGATPRDPRRPAVYVASNKGLLLRISCQTDQIICAYQLHTCAIRTLSIYSG